MAGPQEDHPAVAVKSHLGFYLRSSWKAPFGRHKAQVEASPSHCWISPGEELTPPAILNFRPRRSHRAWGAGPAPELQWGTTQRRKEFWALQTITSQLRLSVHSPQRCLRPNNLIFTWKILCCAQEEEPETKAILFDITIPAEDKASLLSESK